ncbi:hypothetical protein Tco_0737743 [Tanacetum coccineum]
MIEHKPTDIAYSSKSGNGHLVRQKFNMSRENPQATIVSEEQLVLRANRLVIKKNNQRVASYLDIIDTMLRFMSPPDPNNTYTKPPLENQILRFIKILDTNSDEVLYSSCSEESENETNDADDSDMDLSDDNPDKDDDAAGFGVFMYNKSTEIPNSTYLSPTVTSSSLDFIQNLLNETPANELTDLVSNPVYTDAQTTSAVIYPEGNHELTSYISCASEVPLGTHVDFQATNVLLQEMFPDENAHHKPSLPVKKIPYNATTPQPSSLQAKAKKLMQKAKPNMRKINFKKAVIQKFREYDQNLEALTNFNVSEAFEKAVQAKVLT